VLQLATGKISIDSLDPGGSPRFQPLLRAERPADSARRAWQAAFDSLRLGQTLDSASAALERLRHARATDLATLNEPRQTIDRLKRCARSRHVTRARREDGSRRAAGRARRTRQRAAGDYGVRAQPAEVAEPRCAGHRAALFAPGAIKPFERGPLLCAAGAPLQ